MRIRVSILSFSVALAAVTACGYRGALHASYIPEVTTPYEGVAPEYQELAALLEKDTGIPPSTGNTVSFIPEGNRKLDLTLWEIQNARQSIYLDYYRICIDSVGTIINDLLKQKAGEGLDVRVMVDGPAVTFRDQNQLKKMKANGADFRIFYKPVWFLDVLVPPAGVHRDHRKIFMIDGKTAYMGGRNIQDKYYTSWRDADVRITGPAIEQIAKVYMENQLRVNREPQPLQIAPDLSKAAKEENLSGEPQFRDATIQIVHDSPTDKVLPIRNCFEWTINHAQKYFWLYCPYTPPPKTTIKALKDAAARGVDVRWIIPGVSDVFIERAMQEALYKELLEAGVKLYEYNGGILHAKQFMCDDYLMAVGSANMDNLSFFLNYEVEVLMYDEALTRHTAEIFLKDLDTHCVEVSLEEVRRWNIFRKFRNWFVITFGAAIG